MVVLEPSLSGLAPKWVVYHDISFPGSLALKNTPPIPVTQVGPDELSLGFCSAVEIHLTDRPQDILARDNTFLFSSVPHTLQVFSGPVDLRWQAGQYIIQSNL